MLGSNQWSGVRKRQGNRNVLTGKKLLLADDSAAIQKVIHLTFADEGMTVTTVGNGRAALEELEHFPPPDVILADVFMPEVGGLELCRLIKQNERFARIPVILLISSFELFDEAEARRAGADDIVTKPFQSIRDLVNRVGSLLGGEAKTAQQTSRFSTLGLTQSEPQPTETAASDQNVTVLVEAPKTSTQETEEIAGATGSGDVELQTADTRKLERIVDEPDEATSDEDDARFHDTIEMEATDLSVASEPAKPVEPEEPQYSQFAETTEINMELMPSQAAKAPDDALLDLEEAFGEETITDEVYLDLEFEEALPVEVIEAKAQAAAEPVAGAQEKASSVQDAVPAANLSPDAVDAIARRVVEQMSDKAVREIAWEVVPELAELMIKKKLDEQE